jgi:hypothetical protein
MLTWRLEGGFGLVRMVLQGVFSFSHEANIRRGGKTVNVVFKYLSGTRYINWWGKTGEKPPPRIFNDLQRARLYRRRMIWLLAQPLPLSRQKA